MTWTRPRDEYDRAYYAPNEIPPATERYAHWRGKLTSGYEPGPNSMVTHSVDKHDAACVGGWIASGEWWLHCGICRAPVVRDASVGSGDSQT